MANKVLGSDSLVTIREWVKTKVEALKNEFIALFGAPLVASTASDMVDHSKIYVYLGSETGYINGDWYYYNGSTWVSGGAHNPGALEVDSAFSISGLAADAKATGDRLNALEEAVGGFDELEDKVDAIPDTPTTNGDYILRRANGVNSYASFTASGMNLVSLSGSTVTQTGAANTMYICGTLTELTFTAPLSGICGIRFSTGSTPTVLTVNGVSYWMNEFDPSSLEASKTYEINILNTVGVASC